MKVYQHQGQDQGHQGQGQGQGQEGSPPTGTALHHPHADHIKTEHAAMTGNFMQISSHSINANCVGHGPRIRVQLDLETGLFKVLPSFTLELIYNFGVG